MKNTKLIFPIIIACVLVLSQATAQLKVGKSPTNISANTNFEVEATDTSKFVISKTNGKVGIGTATPANTLHVRATSNPLKLEGLQAGSSATAKVLVVDSVGVVKELGTLNNALSSVSVPKPALFKLTTSMSDFLNGISAGSLQVVPMDMVKNSIDGLTYNATTHTITFPAGTYQMTFVYEGEHNAAGCNLSSYIVDFPDSGGTTRRIHSTASHNEGGTSNHGGTVSYATQLNANTSWQITLGRGQSGNCNGTGNYLYAYSTEFLVYRIGD